MTISQADYHSLKALPCFSTIVAVELLADGMSQTCIKVTTPKHIFLAKKLNDATANTEVSAALICAEQALSPGVIHHDNQWLITEFITGFSLSNATLKSDKQVSIALKLMTKLHQLARLQPTVKYPVNGEIPLLDIKKTITALLAKPLAFSAENSLVLIKLTTVLMNEINDQITRYKPASVVCHGDINFSNILIGAITNDHINDIPQSKDNHNNSIKISDLDRVKHRAWLIDFECAHLAPLEYDLAMFMAVNNIAFTDRNELVNTYLTLAPSAFINKKLLTYYLLSSYFINGLWYLAHNTDSTRKSSMFLLATKQWSAFDNTLSQQPLVLPQLMPLIS
ncbi:hypothetical protein [Colwellia ponticola]|uniref:Aminoglycoside phosphotransferase domain-containing protein n=1 Tax=Colwellia ponticola TaxID=2304625 RepID=A0A8H2JLY0_9GAMM|nr:hypothetical protein [Colwellia ponticola]TMM45780.1 hypothetical protein FCS21_08155 [Colwellia ponticola]